MYDKLSQANILIIDDFSQFRRTFITMLQRLGAQHIDQASNGVDAIKLCMEKDYDIIFCDYNLGDSQDGQQVLEELHERAILQKGSLFIMVTAETSSAQVMGAIEYRPDAYITKPFTNEQLGQRLKRLIKKNETLRGIYDAINEGKLNQALKLCDEVMIQAPTTQYSCLRLKSEILEQQKKYDAAMSLYESVIHQQPLLWALLGIGRLMFAQGNVEQALKYFIEMGENFPQQVSVYDWIAKCHKTLGKTEQAEESLKQAIDISPKSVNRQAELGELAQSLNHHEIAQKAFERTIMEGHHSCLLKPEHYKQYYDNTREIAINLSGRDQSRLLTKTEEVAKSMQRKYQNEPGSIASNFSSLANLFSSVGKPGKSDDFLSKLNQTLKKPECRISEKQFKQIEKDLNSLSPEQSDDKILDQLSSRMEEMREEIKTFAQNDKSAREVNREGMSFAQQKQFRDALDKFRAAIKLTPHNPNFKLNAAQVILLNETMSTEKKLVDEARSYLDSLSLENSGKRWRLYKTLIGYLADE